MIVVDANVAIYLLVQGKHTRAAQRAYKADPDWRLPPLWRYEFANALVGLVRAGDLRAAEAEPTLLRGLGLFEAGEDEAPPALAMRLAFSHRISAYDAQYVALAQALGVRCLTEDQRLLERAPALTVDLARFVVS